MEVKKTRKPDAARNPKLQCKWKCWWVIAEGELALDMPENNCCDMTGAIEIAKVLMPGVWRIATYAGGEPDTEYQLVRDVNHRSWSGEWKAYDMRGK